MKQQKTNLVKRRMHMTALNLIVDQEASRGIGASEGAMEHFSSTLTYALATYGPSPRGLRVDITIALLLGRSDPETLQSRGAW